jgi:predicted nucleic acid-binding protein
MIYFDTDIWIHSLVEQDLEKHEQANDIIERYSTQDYIISTLNYQEILFVLGKLKVSEDEIKSIANDLFQLNAMNYSLTEVKRASDIAEQIGFRQINDCIHTAIAEKHCTELITYNKKDFSKIAKLTSINIRIL